jgi:4-amino-4-deoxy-L-arabinose transferase-like glycosyltransferase
MVHDFRKAQAGFAALGVHNRLLVSHGTQRRLWLFLAIATICSLYLADLTGMGLYGPDEPRYADIGRAMAATGDLVTPRLWGMPWFEKPALLYWMTAVGFKTGLGPDLAPRLPLAILSLLFLAFFWWRLRAEWGTRVATYAAVMLATSAGWLAYSHVAVTDVPMAVFFSCAWLLALPGMTEKHAGRNSRHVPVAAGSLALATLAKGLVPLVLFVPVLALPLITGKWERVRAWLHPRTLLVFLVVALPWYVLCTLRNGEQFLRVFFVEQQFGRLTSSALQHVQPWWFYLPALLVLLFPWFPLLFGLPAGLRSPEDRHDPRIRTLAAIVIWGLLFFSVAVNKLYGYLIPLLPALFTILAIALARLKQPAQALFGAISLAALLPLAPPIASRALAAHKLAATDIPWIPAVALICVAATVAHLLARLKPGWSFPAAAALSIAGFLWFQFAAFPAFDRYASARPTWLSAHPSCAPAAARNFLYGLYYYSGRIVPPCTVLDPGGTRGVR